jgi:hypothetical protein
MASTSSSSNRSGTLYESIELRNRCGPRGPSIDLLPLCPSKLNALNSSAFGLGVCISSNDDRVVSLLRSPPLVDVSWVSAADRLGDAYRVQT